MPQLGWILGFCAMASLGLPGLAGFWGEFPAILSAYSPGFGLSEPLFRTLMVLAALGTVFAAAYLLWLYQRTAFGDPSRRVHRRPTPPTPSAPPSTTSTTAADIHDVTAIEWIAWTPMLSSSSSSASTRSCCSRSSTRPSPSSSTASGEYLAP